jgi:MFS family permease
VKAPERSGLLGSLARERHLALLWSGQLLSALGDRLHEVALMWIAVEAVGGRAGLVVASGTVARLLFGLPGGVLADRWDRRRLMVCADLVRAAAVGTLALAGLRGRIELWHLALVVAVLATFECLFQPALQASLPALAPRPATLQRANAFLNLNHRLALVLGPSLTGILLAYLPIPSFFAIDAASFVASALAILALGRGFAWRLGPGAAVAAPGVGVELRGAFDLVGRHPRLRHGIALLCIWNLAYASGFTVGLPLFAREVLGAGPETYGYLMGAYGVGNVASTLFLAARPPRRRSLVLFAGGGVYGLGLCGLALAPGFGWALAAAPLAALGGPMTDLMILLTIQTEFPPDQIGKVVSLRYTLSRGFMGLGLVGAAPLFEALPVRAALAAGGALVVVAAVLCGSRVRRAERMR